MRGTTSIVARCVEINCNALHAIDEMCDSLVHFRTECCWDGLPPKPTELKRFVGEWTAAYDQTPSPELEKHFREHPRELTPERFRFLEQFVLAQMMTYEATPEDNLEYLPPKSVAVRGAASK